MPDSPSRDLSALSTAGQARVVGIVGALDPADLVRPVPATPGWSVRDLVAHLAGVSADALVGDVHPESPEWTSGHIRDRSDLSVEQVLHEWLRAGPRVEEMLPPLAVTTAEGFTAVAGRGEPGASVRAGLLEVTRALTGRRSAAQVRAYDWTGDPEPYLPALSLFGELRSHDLVE